MKKNPIIWLIVSITLVLLLVCFLRGGEQNRDNRNFYPNSFTITFIDTLTQNGLKQIIIKTIEEYVKNMKKLEQNGVIFTPWTEAQIDSLRRDQLREDLKLMGYKCKKSN